MTLRAAAWALLAAAAVVSGVPMPGATAAATTSCPAAAGARPDTLVVEPGADGSSLPRFPGPDELAGDGAVVDARRAWWRIPRDDRTFTVPIVFGDGERRDVCLVGGEVRLDLSYASTRYEEWHGDRRDGAPTADNVSRVPNETGGIDVLEPGVAVIGTTIANVGDGVSYARSTSASGVARTPDGWLLDGVRMADVHDDCVENDALVSGRVVDSLFDGCFVFYSATTGGSAPAVGPDGSGETVEITDSLVHLATMPDGSDSGGGSAPGPRSPAHGVMWKLATTPSQGWAPAMRISGSTFLIDGSIDLTTRSLRFPLRCPGISGCAPGQSPPAALGPEVCDRPGSNTVIWAGEGSLADDPTSSGDLADQFATWGPCFEVVDADDRVPGGTHTWREEWGDRRRSWIAEHATGGRWIASSSPVAVPVGPLAAGEVRTIELDAVEGLPPNVDVGSLTLRVTVRAEAGAAAVAVWGEGTPPEGTVVRAGAGDVRSATTLVVPGRIDRGPFEVPSDGSSIRISSDADADVTVEVLGWSAASPATPGQRASTLAIVPSVPRRLADTRLPGRGWRPAGPVAPVGWRTLDLSEEVPPDAVAVVVDVEASGARRVEVGPTGSAAGARVWSGDGGAPTGRLAVIPLGRDRRLRLSTAGRGEVAVDLLAVVRPSG